MRFGCSAGGAVRRGRRRLRRLLGALALFLLAAALLAFFTERVAAGVVALLAVAVPAFAWRAASDHETLWLEVDGQSLEIRMRWRRRRLSLGASRARRLTADEIRDLERLATLGGVTAGSGGFESSRLGELELYASDLRNAVLLDAGDERLVVTPDAADEFVSAVAAAAVAP